MIHILLVCQCNICRSPMASAVLTQLLAQSALAQQLRIHTAGTHGTARGSHPDPRAVDALLRHGYQPQRMRAHAIRAQDFARFDQILAMDQRNLAALQDLCPPEQQHKLGLFMEMADNAPAREIPDPYFGGTKGFERVLQMCEVAARGLIQRWALAPGY